MSMTIVMSVVFSLKKMLDSPKLELKVGEGLKEDVLNNWIDINHELWEKFKLIRVFVINE